MMEFLKTTSKRPHHECYSTRPDHATLASDLARSDAGVEARLRHVQAPSGKLVHILEWVRIEEWSVQTWQGIGRKPHDRSALANAFVAKAVLELPTTRALIVRLSMYRASKRLCGFSMWRPVPDEATFSRAFAAFTQAKLAERVHEALVMNRLRVRQLGLSERGDVYPKTWLMHRCACNPSHYFLLPWRAEPPTGQCAGRFVRKWDILDE